MDLISVIIPVYNVENYLNRCIKSVVGQTYCNLEIILVNDGSPDRCPIMCDEWAIKDQRIKVVHKANGGLSDARNAGIAVASGKYISFVDSDDWIAPEFIELLYSIMRKTDADISECGVDFIDEQGKCCRHRAATQEVEVLDRVSAIKRLISEDGIYHTVWNKLYRRDVIKNISFEKGKLHEDVFWTYLIFDRARRIVVTNKSQYYYFQRSSSIMGQGYGIRNLDGLIAHHKQVEYFSDDLELVEFVKARELYNDLYHFQAAIKHLKSSEQRQVTDTVIKFMVTLGKINYEGSGVPKKYQIWFAAFRRWPFLVARIRNALGIG